MAKETFPSCFSRWASFLPCCCLVTKLCPTLCDPTDCSLSGSSVHGISQARYWGRLPFPSPGDLPDPGIEPASPALQADSLRLSQWGSAPPPHFYLGLCRDKGTDGANFTFPKVTGRKLLPPLWKMELLLTSVVLFVNFLHHPVHIPAPTS